MWRPSWCFYSARWSGSLTPQSARCSIGGEVGSFPSKVGKFLTSGSPCCLSHRPKRVAYSLVPIPFATSSSTRGWCDDQQGSTAGQEELKQKNATSPAPA